MINKIFKVPLYVDDQDAAKDFWINKMGFTLVREDKMMENFRWIEVAPKDDPNTTFILYDKNLMKSQNSNINVGHPSIILYTNDIEKSNKDMKDKGIKVDEIMNYPYGRMFSFLDNEGNSYLVYCEK